ncbi:MFS transporter [Microlunatus panaciterrae]|uniref:MFS family permease n=1 Tax=Microlunatus panaciterrae TaxID=400768 RepID=A0ABS2REU9_9ACTN|nr:MFS transporter [Microlunatus panaciterrae]MBM7797208.1 MFS family permease [Microlunatus panaciterrae]
MSAAEVKKARLAVSAMFFSNGVIFANVLPRYPELKASLGLSNAALGTALAAHPVGALLAGLFAGWLVSRWGSARVPVVGTLVLAVAFTAIGWAPSWVLLALAFFVCGMLDSVIDIGSNAHGLRVQRLLGRSIINSLHGVWSVGAVVGGLMGSAAAGLRIPIKIHLGVVGVLMIILALVVSRWMLAGPDRVADHLERTPTSAGVGARRMAVRLLAIGGIAVVGAAVEDVGNSWGALWVTAGLGAPVAAAGSGFVAMMGAMTVGRFLGDPAVERLGPRRVTRLGMILAAAGLGVAVAWPGLVTTYVGFALAGLGAAVMIPMAMHAADEVPGLGNGVGLAVVGWITRVGFLLSPPVIGVIADQTSLRFGLAVAPLAALAGLLLTRTISPAGVHHQEAQGGPTAAPKLNNATVPDSREVRPGRAGSDDR